MSRTKHFLDCHCRSCVNELLKDIEKLEAENKKLKEKIDVLEETIVHYKTGEKPAF